jgi:hypothetical protein
MVSARQLKCSGCKEWNTINSETQNCASCGKPLMEISEAELESLERRRTTGEIKIPIYPDDSFLKRNLKHIFNFVQLIFLAILSFFLWLFAAGPG